MISLHEPEFDAVDEALVLEALRSSWVSSGGPLVDRFEREFASYTGASHAVSVANGTVAIQLILSTLAVEQEISSPFDVIIPTLTFIATANAVVHAGGHPVLVDAAAGSMNLDPDAVLDTISQGYVRDLNGKLISRHSGRPLLCIMPAHIMGYACDMDRLADISRSLVVPIVEDAAEALGSFQADGTHLGRRGRAAAFSFNGNKILTTGGGGMIVTDSAEFAQKVKHLSTTAKIDGLRFVHDEVGYNFRMVNLLAALGCSQIGKLPNRLIRKADIAARYRLRLAELPLRFYEEPMIRGNHWLVNIIFQSEAVRESVLLRLINAGIQARPLWTPIHLQPAFRNKDIGLEKSFAHAEHAWRCALSLPSSPSLSNDTIDDICKLIREAAGAHG